MKYKIQKTGFLSTANILQSELTTVEGLNKLGKKISCNTNLTDSTVYSQELFKCSKKFPALMEPYGFITNIPEILIWHYSQPV